MDNIGDYVYLKNGSFKFEIDPHHFNAKWLIMLGFLDLRRPRVARRSNVGLVFIIVFVLYPSNILSLIWFCSIIAFYTKYFLLPYSIAIVSALQ